LVCVGDGTVLTVRSSVSVVDFSTGYRGVGVEIGTAVHAGGRLHYSEFARRADDLAAGESS